MAVGAQQDRRCRPVGPDGPEHPAQEGADFRALRALGGPQHGRDKAALAIEHHDRLEPVFVIVGIEQPQLLAAVHGVEGVIHVEHNPLGRLPEGRAIHQWSLATGKEVPFSGSSQGGALFLAYSPDGKVLAAGGLDTVIYLWEPSSGKELRASAVCRLICFLK